MEATRNAISPTNYQRHLQHLKLSWWLTSVDG